MIGSEFDEDFERATGESMTGLISRTDAVCFSPGRSAEVTSNFWP